MPLNSLATAAHTQPVLIPVYQPYMQGREKEYVNQCLDSTWISSKGEFINKFEGEFSRFIKAPYVTNVVNGTVALHLAILALGLQPGDEIIVPSFTYIASVNMIVAAGAVPVFVDSIEETLNLDPADVKRKITAKTKAVMAVHLYGLPCDMDALMTICTEHKLYLIEDCAEAFGALYKGQHVGTFGDVATFSFFGNKTITTGEGGMVVTKTQELLQRAYHLKTQGVSSEREYWHDEIAYNYRMTNIAAAIGLAQLEQADHIIAKKRQIADWYRAGLQGLPLKFHDETPGMKHSYWMCTILLNDAGVKQGLRDYLKAAGIETRPTFYPAHTMPHCKTDDVLPVAATISAKGMNLPSFPALQKPQVDFICGQIKHFVQTA